MGHPDRLKFRAIRNLKKKQWKKRKQARQEKNTASVDDSDVSSEIRNAQRKKRLKFMEERRAQCRYGSREKLGDSTAHQLRKYRENTSVAIKEVKDGDGKKDPASLQKALRREAEVILQLGDHKGLPYLFGICSKEKPALLVTLYHGDETNLTIYKATKPKPSIALADWGSIFAGVADALHFIHGRGFVHNDLKGNNVVLEGEAGNFNPMIIDFVSAVNASLAKCRVPTGPPLEPHRLINRPRSC
ncbi:predicted protein [Nematostella vectensis]|uniref:Protein kinase domain-containing protein n=1 Tax=Nematostella vectensis TaxID=45351 RepID=A7SKZ3_NEMVE|nr:predicted protein [Nematostella vectensis]|eukprot:XP_001627702.1 predicted protein [Nematostella vectensis]